MLKNNIPLISQQLEPQEQPLPLIKGIKPQSQRRRYSIIKVERQIIYKKYRKDGYSHQEADGKVKKFCSFIKDLVIKLKEADKSEDEIEVKVNQQMEIICRIIENDRGE